MIPISLYKIENSIGQELLNRYAYRINVLIASKFDSDRSNYQRFLSSQFPNSRVDVSDYDGLKNKLANSQYDVLVLDNDAFFVDKSPALDALPSLGEFIDRNRIIITAALNSPDLVNRVSALGARFIEKGKWRTLEQTINDLTKAKQLYKQSA